MLKIQRFVCNMIRENCYVVSDSTGECVIIDCGAYYEEERRAVVDYIRSNHLTPKHLLATHGHVDHNFGNNTIADEFGLKVECGSGDEGFMNDLKGQAEKMFNVVVDYDFPPVGHFFTNEEVITFGDHKFATIATPGHSPGGTTFYCAEEKVAFTGDTLFRNSIGRTDFDGGSMFMMINSLRELAQLPDDTTVLPGHGDATTIGAELANNPYMDR